MDDKNFLFRKRIYIILIILYLITILLSIFLNIIMLREILCFILLTFLPGFLIIIIIGLAHLEFVEIIVFSVGLSEAFLMIYGWLFNAICLSIGIDKPLTLAYLLPGLMLPILIILLIIFFNSKVFLNFKGSEIKLLRTEKLLAAIAFIFPITSIVGTYIMNMTGNNNLLLVTLISFTVFIMLMIPLKEKDNFNVYPYIIFMISVSLVIMWALRTDHIIGTDAHLEFQLFLKTLSLGQWNSTLVNSSLTSCLSISILPTIYQIFTNINPEYLFRILYPLIVSFTPIVVFLISKRYMTKYYAFLSSFLFMSCSNFQMTTALARTNIAILFFSLIILIITITNMSLILKKALAILFIISVILSHYSTAYICLVILLASWLVYQVVVLLRKDSVNKVNSFYIICIALSFIFIWFSSINNIPFNLGVNFIASTFRSLQSMFILESRNIVPGAVGVGLQNKGIPQHIAFVTDWLVIMMMILGNLIAWWLYIKKKSLIENKEAPGLEILTFSTISIIILGISVVAPYISVGYDLARLYLQLSVILTLFSVYVFIYIANIKMINKYWATTILVIIISLYYFGQTSVSYQLYGYNNSIIMNDSGWQYDLYYIHSDEITSATWLNSYTTRNIYSDYCNTQKLTSENITVNYDPALINRNMVLNKGIIYLLYHTVIDNKVIDDKYNEYYFNNRILYNLNNIYDNGGSSIYDNS